MNGSSLLLAVSDVVWQAIIAAVLAMFMAAMKLHTDRLTRIDNRDTQEKLGEIKIVTKATYAFQNHAMGIVKKALAVSTALRAETTGKAQDIAEAEQAAKEWADHQVGQAKVDAQVILLAAAEEAKKVLMEASKAIVNPTEREIKELVIEHHEKSEADRAEAVGREIEQQQRLES